MFRGSRPPTEAGVFALGKFAGHPEFLRAENDGAVAHFDAWMDQGMTSAHERWGSAWRAAFPMGVAYGFLWRAARGDDARLCGVIAPSCDSIGRDYPLAVAARFPRALVDRAPHVVPLAFGDFLDAVYETVADVRVAPVPPADLAARVRSLRIAGVDDIRRAEAEYAAWGHDTRLEAAWSAVFPCPDPIGAAARALDALAAALAPFRGREEPDTSLVLRLPLGTGGPAAAALWIDIVRRMCRWSWTSPSAFWAVDDGSLLIAPGAMPPAALAELWRADPSSEVVFDVANADGDRIPSSGFRTLPEAVRAGAGATSMQAFLDSIGS